MLSRIIGTLTLLLVLVQQNAMAGESALWMPQNIPPAQESELEPVAVIYFDRQTQSDQQHAASIQLVIAHAKSEFGLQVNEYILENENLLAETVDKIADSPVGLIIIVAPHDHAAVTKIPSLYPDIRFSLIGLDKAEYYPNGHSMIFKEDEGIFLIGALAAWHSQSGIIKFYSSEDTPLIHHRLDTFTYGAQYAKKEVKVINQLALKAAEPDNADIAFLYDDGNLPMVLRDARQSRHLLITYDHNIAGEYPGLILTTLVKRYDLAIYTTLKNYQSNQWKAGSQSLGISQGYMDYSLSSNNNTLISENIIDKLETLKDLTARSIVKISPPK